MRCCGPNVSCSSGQCRPSVVSGNALLDRRRRRCHWTKSAAARKGTNESISGSLTLANGHVPAQGWPARQAPGSRRPSLISGWRVVCEDLRFRAQRLPRLSAIALRHRMTARMAVPQGLTRLAGHAPTHSCAWIERVLPTTRTSPSAATLRRRPRASICHSAIERMWDAFRSTWS
jgi:hypothetical protein